MSTSKPSVIISISYGDREKPVYERTTHLLTFEEVTFDNDIDAARDLADYIIGLLQSITHKDSEDKPIFGIYKEEFPILLQADPKVN